MTRPSKRYLLVASAGEMTARDTEDLARVLEPRHGRVKVIPVEGNRRAVIVKTTNEQVAEMQGTVAGLAIGGMGLTPILTSGAIGKLKKRAREMGATEVGQVP
jgi:hypothetical protein